MLPPGDGAPAGRRSNGLPSVEWGALVDLDPRLSEALLQSLAAEGVAAFVEPAHDVDTYTRATVLPKRPLDRLWVDPAQADVARGVVSSEVADLTALLAEEQPGMTAHGLVRPVPRTAATRVLPPPELPERPTRLSAERLEPQPQPQPEAGSEAGSGSESPPATLSDDEIFRQIVAGFDDEVADPVARWPVAEDLGEQAGDRRSDPAPHRADDTEKAPKPAADNDTTNEGELPDWVEPAALEDHGHYVPPPPPPFPKLRLRTLGALLMCLVGLVLLFIPFRVGLSDDVITTLFGLVLLTGGAALLVASMRDAPSTGSGPDDGAVV